MFVNHPVTGKPEIKNPDGSVSTERTITIQKQDGRYYNIPTIVNGIPLSHQQAITAHNIGSNPEVSNHKTLPEALTSAKARTQMLGEGL